MPWNCLKRRAVQKCHKTLLEAASVDLAFTIIHAKDDHPMLLNEIVGELQKRGNYEPVFVRDFAPVDQHKWYMYIKQLEKGLSASWSLKRLDPVLKITTTSGKFHHVKCFTTESTGRQIYLGWATQVPHSMHAKGIREQIWSSQSIN